MAEKNARILTQPSNRAKSKNALEKKVVYKSTFSNPFRIQWPSIPLNLQNAILAKIIQVLDGISQYQHQKFTKKRKRKHKDKANPSSKRQKHEGEATGHVNDDVPLIPPQNPQFNASSVTSPEKETLDSPSLFRHILYGINVVTKRLEEQTRAARRPVIASVPNQTMEDSTPAVKYVFVCRNDVNPTLLLDHLPHLVAAYNSTRPSSYTILVLLPKGAEFLLAQALGIRRVSVFGIDTLWSEDTSLKLLLDQVPVLTAPWLFPAETSRNLVPTHVKLLRTSAPKDMKAAKELRSKERAKAKQSRQNRPKKSRAIILK